MDLWYFPDVDFESILAYHHSRQPLEMSEVELATSMGVPIQRVNTLINGKRDVTAQTAILLARVLKTSSEFWMNLQVAFDLYQAQRTMEHAT